MTERNLSLRDPAGQLIMYGQRFIRVVYPEGVINANACLTSETIRQAQEAGRFIRCQLLTKAEWPRIAGVSRAAMVLEHDAVAFQSYPSEWTPSMLADAGELTIALASSLTAEGLGLKDATPLNVLFSGSAPIFVDALSVEPRAPDDPVWFAYGQYIRSFILPLIAAKYLRWPLRRTFTGARDGLEPELLLSRLPLYSLASPAVRSSVTGPVLLASIPAVSSLLSGARRSVSREQATFVLQRLYSNAKQLLSQVGFTPAVSSWTNYFSSSNHPEVYHTTRKTLVARVIEEARPTRILDIGTNDATFALLAASLGPEVVAIDRDESVVEIAYRRIREQKARVLPLVVDLADPTPASGWRNEERLSFLERAKGKFDMVLCLAMLHHLVVGDSIPMRDAFEQLRLLTQDWLVIEFVPVDDPCCKQLAHGRRVLPQHWSHETFVAEAVRSFVILSRTPVSPHGREVFVMRRRIFSVAV